MGTLEDARLNPHGGAIAMGHPVGASGARIVLHLARSLQRKSSVCSGENAGDAGKTQKTQKTMRGMAAICIGGGLGGAALLETVS